MGWFAGLVTLDWAGYYIVIGDLAGLDLAKLGLSELEIWLGLEIKFGWKFGCI